MNFFQIARGSILTEGGFTKMFPPRPRAITYSGACWQ